MLGICTQLPACYYLHIKTENSNIFSIHIYSSLFCGTLRVCPWIQEHTQTQMHDKILLARKTPTKYLVADSSETEESKSQSQLHDKYRANGIWWIMYASGEEYPRWQDTVQNMHCYPTQDVTHTGELLYLVCIYL